MAIRYPKILLLKNIYPLIFILLILFDVSCSKENIESTNLAEILIGEWKLTEIVDVAIHGDGDWHEYSFPELGRTVFQKDSVIMEYMSFAEERGTYKVSNDTIYFSILWNFAWIVIDFDDTELTVSTGKGVEGETKRRYTKVD